MKANANVAKVATLVSESSRAAILTILLDGRFHPVSDLAYMVGIKPQTASYHLAKMVEADVIDVETHGRHRYYGIRNQEIAQVMESFLQIAPPVEVRSLRQSFEEEALRRARTCYDHIAGSLGVKLTNALLENQFLREGQKEFHVTTEGEAFFSEMQIEISQLKKNRRKFCHKCLDWSERRHHMAGAVGKAMLDRLLELNWIQKTPNSRALKITSLGEKGLNEKFGIAMASN
ncbi:ArsR/SmtB family transcription factor [Virgibacillus dakarensis]|uniref:ArsR/SmtB family transcription factor n=1 Tax=Virgibacillus dakarensis TaxID=1917889 RepID=UPI000B446C9D|nr:winged helix-turn-helix domain-containing protein [Virgibacillus dakarensis]